MPLSPNPANRSLEKEQPTMGMGCSDSYHGDEPGIGKTREFADEHKARDDGEQCEPLTFVRLTDLAQQLPARQLNALIGLLRFCWTEPRCWPAQKTLADLRQCSVGKINRGLAELGAAGVVAISHQRHGKQKRCVYWIAPGYWLPIPKKARDSARRSRLRTEIDSREEIKTPPLAPHAVGGDAGVVSQSVGKGEGDGIEAEAIKATPSLPSTDAPLTARYRNRQRRAGDPPKPRRKRRRQILTENIAIWDAVVQRRIAARQPPQTERDALPPPPEILPPESVALARPDNLPRPVTALMEGFDYAVQARIARRFEEYRDADHDVAGALLDRRRVA